MSITYVNKEIKFPLVVYRRRIYIQVHENSSYPLTTILSVEFVVKIIKVRFVFLTSLIVEDLKAFAMFCKCKIKRSLSEL